MALVDKALTSAIGLVVNKACDAAALRLNKGGLTKQAIGGLIEREIRSIKKTLKGLATNDLKTSIDSFEVALEFLGEAIDSEGSTGDSKSALGRAEEKIANGLINVTDLEEEAGGNVAAAKERFKMAREKATAASNCDALCPSDRIIALRYRVMAVIFENPGNLAMALTECRHCLKKLHSFPVVQDSFKVGLKGGWLNKEDRRELIATVVRINHVIYNVTQLVDRDAINIWSWPYVNTGVDRVDPLRDARITKVLQKLGMEECHVALQSFGQEGVEAHKLKSPWRLASDTQGNFIIADNRDGNVKVFDGHGVFQHEICHPSCINDDGTNKKWHVFDAVSDAEHNIYVLFDCMRHGAQEYGVLVKSASQQNAFYLRKALLSCSWYLPSLAVTENNKVLIRGKLSSGQHVVDVYESYGQHVLCFGESKLKNASAITAAGGTRVMLVDEDKPNRFVRMFDSESGDQLFKFKVERSFSFADVAFHKASEQIIVAGIDVISQHLWLLVYSCDGYRFLRSVELDVDGVNSLRSVTVTPTGHIGIAVGFLKNSSDEEFDTPAESFLETKDDYRVLVV